jgi:hypothetical protein
MFATVLDATFFRSLKKTAIGVAVSEKMVIPGGF